MCIAVRRQTVGVGSSPTQVPSSLRLVHVPCPPDCFAGPASFYSLSLSLSSVFCSSFPLLSDLELETLVRLVSLQTLVVLRKVVPEVGFSGLCFDLSSPEPDGCAPCCLCKHQQMGCDYGHPGTKLSHPTHHVLRGLWLSEDKL